MTTYVIGLAAQETLERVASVYNVPPSRALDEAISVLGLVFQAQCEGKTVVLTDGQGNLKSQLRLFPPTKR